MKEQIEYHTQTAKMMMEVTTEDLKAIERRKERKQTKAVNFGIMYEEKRAKEYAIVRALKMACVYHAGQTDKAGEPYIQHPIEVMQRVKKGVREIVALLHDILEDTDCTLEQVQQEFGDVVADAVYAITRQKGESYNAYIRRLCENSIALDVKIADIGHNMESSRIAEPTEKDYKRLERYGRTLEKLKAARVLKW